MMSCRVLRKCVYENPLRIEELDGILVEFLEHEMNLM